VNTSPNPGPGLFLIIGAGLCLGAVAYDSADYLTEYPGTIVTVAAVTLIVLALVTVVSVSEGTEKASLLIGTLLAGYMAQIVVFTLYVTHDFRDGVILATAGGAMLLIGAMWGVATLGRNSRRQASGSLPQTAYATSAQSAAAPAGWYPDPAGGPGHRYWDGASWGQMHP
jgi:hypothetical protein